MWAVVGHGWNTEAVVQATPSQGWARVSVTPDYPQLLLGVSAGGTQLFAAAAGYAADRQPSAMAIDGSTPPRPLTPGPWRASISDVSAHPKGEGWVVVAREIGPREARAMEMGASSVEMPKTHAFILDGEHMPRKVEGSEGADAARFAPDGEDVLVAIELEERGSHALREAELLRVSPDGQTEELGSISLTNDHQTFVANAWGAAWARADGTIVLEDPHGGRHELEPPVPIWRPASIWLGPGTVVAAYAKLVEEVHGTYVREHWEGNKAALALFDLSTGASEAIGEAIWFAGGGASSKSTIVGYDATVPAVVTFQSGDQPGVRIFQKRDGTWYPPVPMALR